MIKVTPILPVFKGVYRFPNDDAFNPEQAKVAQEIIQAFQEQNAFATKPQSYEQRFKKMGYDFLISPNDRYLDCNSVFLYAVNGFYKTNDRMFYSEKKVVGQYDKNKKFDIKDIFEFTSKDTEVESLSNSWLLIILAGLLAFIGYDAFKNKPQSIKKNSMEIVKDSLNKNKPDSILMPKIKTK